MTWQPQGWYLPPNEGNEAPWRWMAFDTETRAVPLDGETERLALRLVCSYFWERERPSHPGRDVWSVHREPLDFIHHLERFAAPRTRLICAAHNVQFDAQVLGLLPRLTQRGWTVQTFVNDYQRSIFKVRRNEATIVLVDSMNWFPVRLVELGETLGIPKLRMPADDAPFEQWQEYCNRDVRIVAQALKQWQRYVEEHDYGVFALTLAGQAWNAFRHKFMYHRILVDKNEPRVALARQSYMGGRTECYQMGQLPRQRWTMVDVNSLYPAVMQSHDFPVRPRSYVDKPGTTGYSRPDDPSAAIAVVRVTADKPLLPMRHKGRLVFPVGTFTTTLAGPELELAARHDYIERYLSYAEYTVAPIFAEYVAHFYAERMHQRAIGNHPYEAMAKLMLNTLYGKFGQKAPIYTAVDTDAQRPFASEDVYDADERRWRHFRTIGGTVYEQTGSGEGAFAVPAIASFVTSYARLALLKLIEQADRQNVVYVDTDALVVNDAGLENLSDLLDDEVLGALKIIWQDEDVAIYGAKQYRHGTRIKAAGLSRTGRMLPDGTFVATEYKGMETSWRDGLLEGVLRRLVHKRLSNRYQKGTVAEDGSVAPLVLAES